MMKRTLVGSLFLLLSISSGSLWAHTPAEACLRSTRQFLASLNDQQRDAARFDFDNELREDWQFIPMERKGLPLKAMQPHQQQYALSMISSVLSHQGTYKAAQIMALEQILHVMEDNSPRRDPTLYHFFVFGTPSAEKTWGWRVEGHHLSVSVTIVDGKKVAVLPSFYGANPAHVKQGPHKGLHVLEQEELLARKLVKSLSEQQASVAIFSSEAPDDIINGPGRDAEPLEPHGLQASELNKRQQKMLTRLIRAYVFNLRPELARQDMKKIQQAGMENIHFAWAGGTEPGERHYYRIQGPTFIMEYDNTQNNANHVHTVWRDFENDFGRDWLKEHYQNDH